MDFKQFRYFVTVAEEMHVGRAADKLCVAQPALSQQIQQLEARLGAQLFSREKRRLVLNPVGHLFLEQARQALQQADYAMQIVKRSERGEIGQIKIGYVDSAMLGVTLGAVLSHFRTSRPQVELVLHSCNVADQLAGLAESKIDVGFVRGPLPVSSASLECELVEREELVVCLPAGHRLASCESVDAKDLRDETFVMPFDPPGVGLAGQIGFIGQEAGFVPRVSQYTSQTTTMAGLVGAGFGVSILPASLKQLHLPTVVYRPLLRRAATYLYLMSRSDERRPAVRALLSGFRSSKGAAPDDAGLRPSQVPLVAA